MRNAENIIEGRNPVLEALRAGREIDKLFLLSGVKDGPLQTIGREAKKREIVIQYVTRERLDMLSETKKHQGVIAYTAAFSYASVEELLSRAAKRNEPPFLLLLDGIEDPHNLGAIIRTANLSGAHGVIIPKHRATGLTAAAVKASAGAVSYTPVAKVTNMSNTIEELKQAGLWVICAAADGGLMYEVDLTGPVALVIGNEGSGVSPLVKKHCDLTARIPMRGDIDSLNASVAAGVLCFEAVRQRMN